MNENKDAVIFTVSCSFASAIEKIKSSMISKKKQKKKQMRPDDDIIEPNPITFWVGTNYLRI